MDLASRRIVGWSMSERMKAGLVCQALRSAYGQCRPPVGLILHSDQGVNTPATPIAALLPISACRFP